MSLQRRFLLYLVVLHVAFALCAAYALRDQIVWFLAVEVFFVVSLAVGVRLVRAFFGPLKLIRSGRTFLREGDLTTRFSPTGQRDMDELVDVYNKMVDSLREERIHNEEQEHLLQKVLAESPGGVITLEVNGHVASVNPAAASLLSVSAGDLVGQPLAELGTSLAAELGALLPGSSQLLTLNGRRRIRCQKLVFMDRGFPRHFLLLDELTDELHRSEKRAYEKLIRMMSHEVNNTSGAVQSLLQSCLAYRDQLSETDQPDFTRALEVAINRTANLDAFMSGFADVVRLPRPRRQTGDPWQLARQVGLLFQERCSRAGIAWRENIDSGLPQVDCDPVQMEQVLVNVVKNALEAVESRGTSGEIVIVGRRRGRRAELAVEDSGPGLEPEVRDQIFTPFFTTRDHGQGLGLTMVQEILLAHGFEFALENREGGGARFSILF